MDPKDFTWTEDQQVTVSNPTAEDFRWKVHGKEYLLGAGKTAKMPGFIAWLYVYNQAVKAVQEDGKFNRWNDEDFRPQYYERFVVGIDELVHEVAVEQEPEVTVFGDDTDKLANEPVAPKHVKPTKA